MKEVKSKLLTKLATAFKIRAVQAHAARSVIDSIGGPFIVAGDFNDIPGCYAMRVIRCRTRAMHHLPRRPLLFPH